MKIGLLLCDDVRTEFQKEHNSYPHMFDVLLKRQNPDVELVIWRVLDMKFPDSVDACDYWIISGSKFSANDQHLWITSLEAFIRELDAANKKLIGVCFGHQVMANALGGSVVRSEKGWGVGIYESQIVHPKPWIRPALKTFKLLVSHRDQVSSLPPSAEVVASNDFCPNFMVQYNDHFLSIQGHPEFSKKFSAELMVFRRQSIGVDALKSGMESLGQQPDSDVVAQWMLEFFKSQ